MATTEADKATLILPRNLLAVVITAMLGVGGGYGASYAAGNRPGSDLDAKVEAARAAAEKHCDDRIAQALQGIEGRLRSIDDKLSTANNSLIGLDTRLRIVESRIPMFAAGALAAPAAP